MAVKYLDSTGLGYVWSKFKAWCNATFAAITHSHASNAVNAMTGYSKPNSGSAIATSDSLNSAIGKLEAKVDFISDNNCVHKTGDEIIDGTKVFKQLITSQDYSFTRGTVPNENHYPFFYGMKDSAGNMLGGVYYVYTTGKKTLTHLMCYKGITNENVWEYIGIGYNELGNVYTHAPTPPVTDDSDQIATTYWCRRATGNFALTASDVYLAELNATAKGLGQLGYAARKDGVDCNSITSPGYYLCLNCTIPLHYPFGPWSLMLHVEGIGNSDFIYQYAYPLDYKWKFTRYYDPTNTTWSPWKLESFHDHGPLSIFISKDGNDANSGIHSNYPVRTFIRAREIARGANISHNIYFHVGPGDWGDEVFFGDSFKANYVIVTDYNNTRTTAKNDFDNMTTVPTFTSLSFRCGNFYVGNVVVKLLHSIGSIVVLDSYLKFSTIETYNSRVELATAYTVMHISGWNKPVIDVDSGTTIHGAVKGTFESGCEQAAFIRLRTNAACDVNVGATWDGTFSGIKFNSWGSVSVTGMSPTYYPGIFNNADTRRQGSEGTLNTLLFAQNSNFVKGVVPDGERYMSVFFGDNRGTDYFKNAVGVCETVAFADGIIGTFLKATANVANASTSSVFTLFYNKNNNSGWATLNCHFLPTTDNFLQLGNSAARFGSIWAGNGVIQTSDERLKTNIDNIPDELLDAWEEVNWVQFKMKDAVLKKNSSARYHTGVVAQQIQRVFKNKDVDPTKYGFFCWDEWNDASAISTRGEVLIAKQKAGDRYSIRYDEALCLEAAYQRRKNKILERRISELETQVENMLQVLESLKGA